MEGWEWYQDSQTFHFFCHCILKANHTEKKWMGIMIERGQFVASRATLSGETGITVKAIRTIEDRLVSSNNILVKSTNKFSVYTIVNYDEYQEQEEKAANEGQTKGNPKANEGQQLKNDKNNKNKNIYGQNFSEFWEVFPKKVKKTKAENLFYQHCENGIDPQAIISGAKTYRDLPDRKPEYTQHPTTWLNGKGWEDEHLVKPKRQEYKQFKH
jgi:hypothetical protein